MQGTIIICYYIHKHYILSQLNYTTYENHKTQPSQQQDAIISHSKPSNACRRFYSTDMEADLSTPKYSRKPIQMVWEDFNYN